MPFRSLVSGCRSAAIAACSGLALSCRGLTDPPLPRGAERFTAPPAYARWWTVTEACSGITRPLGTVTFYRAPHAETVPDGAYGEVAGYWSRASNRIVLAGASAGDGPVVRHEMLHALVRTGGHPPAYFQGRCAGVVDCPATGCRDAGPAPQHAPADAPSLSVAVLEVGVELLPDTLVRSGPDRSLAVVVSARNPRPEPVRVPLQATPGVPGAPALVGYFGLDLRAVGSDTALLALQQSDSAVALPFAAGETRRFVFDVDLSAYPAGNYVVAGAFNTRRAATMLRILP
jgi:hypothetical protein